MVKGYKQSEEHRKNLSKAWDYDKHFTKSCRAKISKSNTGKKRSIESREKYSLCKLGKSHIAWNKGKHQSLESIEKQKITWMNNFLKNPEMRVKMKEANLGRIPWNKGKVGLIKFSFNTKQKMRLASLGKPKSLKHKLNISESLRGNKCYNWQGGKSFEPYNTEFNKAFREAIKVRDNGSCMICGSNNRLSAHHINYNKLQSLKENCICLCNSCHMKTNFNREHWTKFFQSLLSERYGYQYLEEGIIKLNFECLEVQ